MPGAGRDPWPACRKKAGGSHHRFSRASGIPCAFTTYTWSRRGPAFCHRRQLMRSIVDANYTSIGTPGPHDFAVRSATFVLRAVRVHRIPASAVRDDRPKRPSLSSRDARKHRGDLPDEASAHLRQIGTTGNLRMGGWEWLSGR